MTDPVEFTDAPREDELKGDAAFLAVACVFFIVTWSYTLMELVLR